MKVHQQITDGIVEFSQKQNDYSVSSAALSVDDSVEDDQDDDAKIDKIIVNKVIQGKLFTCWNKHNI